MKGMCCNRAFPVVLVYGAWRRVSFRMSMPETKVSKSLIRELPFLLRYAVMIGRAEKANSGAPVLALRSSNLIDDDIGGVKQVPA